MIENYDILCSKEREEFIAHCASSIYPGLLVRYTSLTPDALKALAIEEALSIFKTVILLSHEVNK